MGLLTNKYPRFLKKFIAISNVLQYEAGHVKTGLFAHRKTKTQISFAVIAAGQRLCFRYTDSMIPLLPISEISSL